MRSYFFILFISLSHSVFGQISDSLCQLSDQVILRQRIQYDSILQLEIRIALYFHEQVNQHRVTKKRDALLWSDTLWIAARNHTVWMARNQKLSHSEIAKTPFFSGKSDLDRVKYVLSSVPAYSMIGENCMQSSFSCETCRTVDDFARFYANEIFTNWKKSQGHNQNMLRAEFTQYGLGVRFDESGQLWSTMVLISFGQNKTGTRMNPR